MRLLSFYFAIPLRMHVIALLALLVAIGLALFFGYIFYRVIYAPYFITPLLPRLEEESWGPHGQDIEDESVKEFRFTISDKVIDDLKYRLKHTRTLTPPLEGVQQQFGFNTNALKPILEYWELEYDWSARENYLNQFPQFRTNIQGLNIHFVHVKPEVPQGVEVLPLLLLHGWPGSVREFYKVIPRLTKAHETYGYAFEIIAPSLPGFGFSDGAVRPGLGGAQIAVVMKNLMLRLGHWKFYVQGGDWGSIIGTTMATLFPQHVAGLHTNMPVVMNAKGFLKIFLGSLWPPYIVDEEHEEKMYPLFKVYGNLLYESGYFHIQSTKPDTVGVGLNDSPAGLAAYILEKFSTATNRTYIEREDAGLLEKFTYDELIDNLMYYWVPQTATTAARIYAESFNKEQMAFGLNSIPISMAVPCAAAFFPNDITYYPDWILKEKYPNLVHRVDYKEGGHFAALEMPEVLSEDIFTAVEKMRRIKLKLKKDYM